MKASEHIAELQALIAEYGDLEVVRETGDGTYTLHFEFEPGFGLGPNDPAEVFLLNPGAVAQDD